MPSPQPDADPSPQIQELEFRIQSLKQANQQLYRQQEQFRTTFAQAAVGIVHAGIGGEFLMVNPMFCSMVGYGADELTQTTFVELTYGEDWDNSRDQMDRLLAGEVNTIDLEHRYCRSDESLIWVHATLSLVRQEDGSPDYLIMVVQDISDRKQAEAERSATQQTLRRATSRLQTLIQNLQAGVLLVDDTGQIVLTNGIFQQMFQLNLRKHPLTRLAYPALIKAVAQRFEQSDQFLATQRHTLMDRQLTTQRPWQLTNGRMVEEDFIPIWMGDEYGGHLCLFRDVTERRQAELALQHQYQQLLLLRRLTHEIRQTLDPQIMFQTTVDSIGSALRCDRCHLYLYEPDQANSPCAAEYLASGQASLQQVQLPVINNCFVQVVLAEDAAIASSNIHRDPLLQDMIPLCEEGDITALVAVRTSYQNQPNGLLVIHQCGELRRWTDGDLEILEAVAAQVGIALAQAKLLTQEKGQRQQLAVQNQELEAARKTAELASHAKGDFLATMSHEIRTPLNAVIGMTGLLKETPLNVQQAEWLEVLRNSSETLLALINDILDFSKIESGQLELEARPLEVRQCIQESLALVNSLAGAKGLEIAFAIGQTVPTVVVGDMVRLRQVLVNLLSNAVKFTDEGRVRVTVEATAIAPNPDSPDNTDNTATDVEAGLPDTETSLDQSATDSPEKQFELHFAVQDTGIGISPEHQAQLFKSFSQVDASITRRYGGTGLGLAICQRLTRLMLGRLWVDSELGVGSTFHFTVVVPEGKAVVMPSALLQGEGGALFVDKQLWVIDDNPVNRQFLTHSGSQWGFTVTTFENAQSALDCLRDEQPVVDVIVVDWRLPGLDGVEFAAALEDYPPYDRVPLVMLTALQSRPRLPAAVADRFCAWLQSPVTRETLHHTLAQALAPVRQPLSPGPLERNLSSPWPDTDASDEAPVPSIASSPGEGDREIPKIPRLIESLELPEFPEPPERSSLRILLAEDNVVNQQVALLMLDRLGYTAEVVGDGREVLAALEGDRYDVILMDLEMPHMDGITAAKEIQQRYAPEVRPQIIALTAFAMEGDRDRCLEAGMDDYMTKPIRKETLLYTLYRAEHRAATRLRAQNSPQSPPDAADHPDHNYSDQTQPNPQGKSLAENPIDIGVMLEKELPPSNPNPVDRLPVEESTAGGSTAEASNAELPMVSQPPSVPQPLFVSPSPPLLSTPPLSEAELARLSVSLSDHPAAPVTHVLWTLEEDMADVLDLSVLEGLLQFGGSSDKAIMAVTRAVTLFFEDASERLRAIAGALEKRDANALRQAAHTLRSSSANLGAQQLAYYCSQLETLAREVGTEGPLPEFCPTTMVTLETAYESANYHLRQQLNL